MRRASGGRGGCWRVPKTGGARLQRREVIDGSLGLQGTELLRVAGKDLLTNRKASVPFAGDAPVYLGREPSRGISRRPPFVFTVLRPHPPELRTRTHCYLAPPMDNHASAPVDLIAPRPHAAPICSNSADSHEVRH